MAKTKKPKVKYQVPLAEGSGDNDHPDAQHRMAMMQAAEAELRRRADDHEVVFLADPLDNHEGTRVYRAVKTLGEGNHGIEAAEPGDTIIKGLSLQQGTAFLQMMWPQEAKNLQMPTPPPDQVVVIIVYRGVSIFMMPRQGWWFKPQSEIN